MIVIWILVVLVLCLDLPFVWWIFKTKKKLKRFSLVPIFLIFAIPFLSQPKIPCRMLLDIVGLMLILLGFFIMMMGGYEFYRKGIISALSRKETSKAKPEEAIHDLVTSGIYRVFRHPQYVGLFTFFIGYFLWLKAFYSLCLGPLILAWFGVIAYIEERYDLELTFGDKYREYKKKVGMFLPKI